MISIGRNEPWLAETALILISSYLNPDHKVFEFGSGGSTLWFANRVKMVISIEHDEKFYEKVKSMLHKNEHANVIFAERPYNKEIENILDESADLIVVDGRDRVKCVISSIPKLKPGGWLILDNSEREYYFPAIHLMKDWNQVHCLQKQNDKYGFTYPGWTTSIFIKPINQTIKN